MHYLIVGSIYAWGFDFIGPIKLATYLGYEYILIATNYMSK